MKKNQIVFLLMTAGFVLQVAGGAWAQGQETKNSPAPLVPVKAILGEWALQVDGGGEYYYLAMTLSLKEEKLAGTISEANGTFTDVPLADLAWDGTTLKFRAVTATPPDGAERSWDSELKLAEGAWSGMLTIADLGMAVPVTGAKK